MRKLRKFWTDERGLELSEYAVMVGLLLVVALAIILMVGGNINRIFTILNDQLSTVS